MLSKRIISLSKWFTKPINADLAVDDQIREQILKDITKFNHFAVNSNMVIAVFPKGIALMEKKIIDNVPIVNFDVVYDDDVMGRVQFWMNATSVKFLGDLFRQSKDKRCDQNFLVIYLGGITYEDKQLPLSL